VRPKQGSYAPAACNALAFLYASERPPVMRRGAPLRPSIRNSAARALFLLDGAARTDWASRHDLSAGYSCRGIAFNRCRAARQPLCRTVGRDRPSVPEARAKGRAASASRNSGNQAGTSCRTPHCLRPFIASSRSACSASSRHCLAISKYCALSAASRLRSAMCSHCAALAR
jgi:hypothetical protein